MSRAAILFLSLVIAAPAFAAKSPKQSGGGMSFASESSSSGGGSRYRQEMLLDLSMHYVRGTKAEDATDSAGRFSIGGMFSDWIGMDLQSLYETRSKSYLVGGDLRISPNEWFFLKLGVGGYADKQTRELTFTPLAGTGIMARLTRDYYVVTEASYFQINKRDNLSFGAGIGLSF